VFPVGIIYIDPSITIVIVIIIKSSANMGAARLSIERPIPT
jgi:hypothetical protein